MGTNEIMKEAGYLSVAAAARAVGVHPSTIHRLSATGALTSQMVGKRRYVSKESLVRHYPAAPIRQRVEEA